MVPAKVLSASTGSALNRLVPDGAQTFAPSMDGHLFWLRRGGPLLVDGAGTSIDGDTSAWERSPHVGTVTYVSPTELELSAPASIAVEGEELIVGLDVGVALSEALARGQVLIPRDTTLIATNVIIPAGGTLAGESEHTSRIVAATPGSTAVISVAPEPVARSLTILGNGWGAQPANVTPELNDPRAFAAVLDGSGCGIAFGHVVRGVIDKVHAYHCGGDQVTDGRNGISGIYLTMGCRYTNVTRSTATFCRIGACEDNYFGIDDDATIGAPRWNSWDTVVTNRNRIGLGFDCGGNSRGTRVRGCLANRNCQGS